MRNRKKNVKFKSVLDKNVSFAFRESYKTLRTNLEYTQPNEKCILITSALSEEAKTTTALNFAITLAENNKRVIIVECDMRRPSLGRYVGLKKPEYGLVDYLTQDSVSDALIRKMERFNIYLIPAGKASQNAAELLNSEKMDVLLTFLKKRFDYVILDAPPVSIVTDALVVGRKTDGAIMVVRSGFAPTKTIRLAKQRLESVGIKIYGVVLTCFNEKKAGWRSGYSYYGSYRYGKEN